MSTTGGAGAAFFTIAGTVVVVVVTTVLDRAGATVVVEVVVVVGMGRPLAARTGRVVVVGARVATEGAEEPPVDTGSAAAERAVPPRSACTSVKL